MIHDFFTIAELGFWTVKQIEIYGTVFFIGNYVTYLYVISLNLKKVFPSSVITSK